MTVWSPMRIWSLIIACGIGIALAAATITSSTYDDTSIDEPLFWLGVVVSAVAVIAHIGAYVHDNLAKGQAEILERLTAIEEQIGEYGDSREVQGQAIALATRPGNGRNLGVLPD